ncbi:hypothetical protein Pcinc_026367 [Petrolisthes cinctipes]|uniref:Uncharacterized protein n=1 Tax=Petrolisthes cinctipes TaxID=88211 RepID=A0AAE1EPH9_PETCI|nr:hypothetical protein Pcinc_036488 [Petrolisthes cinctipes]KAK3868224.1 hypothetical protein Pcinc_026367 [Petrolisthes cinctipes]
MVEENARNSQLGGIVFMSERNARNSQFAVSSVTALGMKFSEIFTGRVTSTCTPPSTLGCYEAKKLVVDIVIISRGEKEEKKTATSTRLLFTATG